MIVVDQEFKSLIPPLTDDEFKQLEENCRRDGIRDALIVWPQSDGTDILIDGHNRWAISAKNAGIPFNIKRMEFSDREAAIRWIILNQFGRRNLSAYDRSLLALKLKPVVSKQVKEKETERKTTYQKSEKSNLPKMDTTKELAKVAGVSHDTIHKVEVIEKKASPQTKQQVRSGEKSINQAWLEIKEKERNQADLSARARLVEAEERHEDFQTKENASFSDRLQDQEDLSEIARSRSREIRNAAKRIIFFGVSNTDFSMITKKTVGEHELQALRNDINDSIVTLTKILETIGR